MTRVLVYGTLRRNGRLHHFMDGAKFIKRYVVKGFDLYSYYDSFPFVVKGNGEIVAELYEVKSKEQWKELVDLESAYIPTYLKEYDAFIFVWEGEIGDHKKIEGDWIKFMHKH
jgi:gamma-glutamylcyclotransferase (GGCT)/AIG2-like uncharacterized protein YtfP